MTARPADSVQCLYFSPTGSTRRIVETIAEGTGMQMSVPVSVTTPQDRDCFSGRIDADLLLVLQFSRRVGIDLDLRVLGLSFDGDEQ